MEFQKKFVDGHEVIFSADWINDLEQEIHFHWYYQQASLVYTHCSRDQKILEIGIGTGLLSDLLRKRGWKINTLDIDEKKNPDFCFSAIDFDYKKHLIETVLAFEIFEHIPLATFKKVIQKLAEAEVKNIFFSLPWNENRIIDLKLKIPKLPALEWQVSIPNGLINTDTHFWELSKKEKILKDKHLLTKKSLEKIFHGNNYTLLPLKKIGNIQYFSAQREI